MPRIPMKAVEELMAARPGQTLELTRTVHPEALVLDVNMPQFDGFEVLDLSSCMNFPAGTSIQDKRSRCRPQVFRYRWPTREMADGHTDKQFVFGCHELEVYPDDRLEGSANAGRGDSLFALRRSAGPGSGRDRSLPATQAFVAAL